MGGPLLFETVYAAIPGASTETEGGGARQAGIVDHPVHQ